MGDTSPIPRRTVPGDAEPCERKGAAGTELEQRGWAKDTSSQPFAMQYGVENMLRWNEI